jgi:hypothetical protein
MATKAVAAAPEADSCKSIAPTVVKTRNCPLLPVELLS